MTYTARADCNDRRAQRHVDPVVCRAGETISAKPEFFFIRLLRCVTAFP
jgi:hypothetical protein